MWYESLMLETWTPEGFKMLFKKSQKLLLSIKKQLQ